MSRRLKDLLTFLNNIPTAHILGGTVYMHPHAYSEYVSTTTDLSSVYILNTEFGYVYIKQQNAYSLIAESNVYVFETRDLQFYLSGDLYKRKFENAKKQTNKKLNEVYHEKF